MVSLHLNGFFLVGNSMALFEWLPTLLSDFENEHVLIRGSSNLLLSPAHIVHIEIEDWQPCLHVIAKYPFRWCAMWAEDVPSEKLYIVSACYEKNGDYFILLTEVAHDQPVMPSQTHIFPAANRTERHIQDMFGIVFSNLTDTRNWTRHQAWSESDYPLRKDFPVEGINVPDITPPDSFYSFFQAQGTGVYEIPVGPVHASIIEPGHFRFQAVGETILNLEKHLGYVHKGIEKIAEGRNAQQLARLAGRVSGDSTVAHTWAACMAMEKANYVHVPERAIMIRAIMAERERIINHVWDIAAICNDVGFAFPYFQLGRLREDWLRTNYTLFGHRLMMDCIIPGGVSTDLNDIELQLKEIHTLSRELKDIENILEQHAGLEDRLVTTGILKPPLAAQLGCLGYVGKASGQDYDTRHDAPYAPYDQFNIDVPVFETGDVAARMQVRLKEIHISLSLLEHMLSKLPRTEGIAIDWKMPFENAEGLGIVEGWRGEIITYVRFGEQGTISRYYPRDPSWLNWPALELLIRGNIVPDFPVCNKSVNGSYSGCDL